jgi:hypothetical protein
MALDDKMTVNNPADVEALMDALRTMQWHKRQNKYFVD